MRSSCGVDAAFRVGETELRDRERLVGVGRAPRAAVVDGDLERDGSRERGEDRHRHQAEHERLAALVFQPACDHELGVVVVGVVVAGVVVAAVVAGGAVAGGVAAAGVDPAGATGFGAAVVRRTSVIT